MISGFGTADCKKNEDLHMHGEGQGKKGGENVTFLTIRWLGGMFFGWNNKAKVQYYCGQ
jgi:hypothetical protein